MTSEKGRKPSIDAWGLFEVAAKRALAKAAIRRFESSGHKIEDLIVSSTSAFFDGVPPRYFHALMRCFLEIKKNSFTYTRHPGDPRLLTVRDADSAAWRPPVSLATLRSRGSGGVFRSIFGACLQRTESAAYLSVDTSSVSTDSLDCRTMSEDRIDLIGFGDVYGRTREAKQRMCVVCNGHAKGSTLYLSR